MMSEEATTEIMQPLRPAGRTMTVEERRRLRKSKKSKTNDEMQAENSEDKKAEHVSELLSKNEDEMLRFVAKVNKVYQEKLKKPAPFMTFVFCGMQSAGKSTIMERFMNAPLNIVQEGTGTRCPLDTTCIHDATLDEPSCDLFGEELSDGGEGLTVDQVFASITEHNMKLGSEDRFSTEPLRLIYRANNVQNMRFVDTPGIISNKSTGKDNRDDIKKILSSELTKVNARLCVLVEPKEFATNPIMDFCDTSLGGRAKWIDKAIFLMTKFDQKLEDSRTASKANMFFKEFHQNKCYPFPVITPTLPKEDLPPAKLFAARRDLLARADGEEKERFDAWLRGHESFRMEIEGGDVALHGKIVERIGFPTAKKKMREIMLQDTVDRLPEVIASLRRELEQGRINLAMMKDRQRFTDPDQLKFIVTDMLWSLQKRIMSYLDGDLGSALNFPEQLQSLEEEIEDEEDSDWSTQHLNFHTQKENAWRDRIARIDGDYPTEVQANKKFLGGKQVQRAIEFYRVILIESLPDPFELKDKVANLTGYLSDGLQRENWEHALVQICKVLMQEVTHPGANFLVKHIGNIFRRLFHLALEDIKQGEEFSDTFKLVPVAVERYLETEFDAMLWKLMKGAAEKMHSVLEPLYSTIDPNLPTFHASNFEDDEKGKTQYILCEDTGIYIAVPGQKEKAAESWKGWLEQRLSAVVTGSGDKAKEILKSENRNRAQSKKTFLPDERTAMITDEETGKILQRSFEYLVALMDFNLVMSRFQVNHYLYIGFKEEISRSFMRKGIEADWSELVQADPNLLPRMKELEDQILSLEDSLKEVQRISKS